MNRAHSIAVLLGGRGNHADRTQTMLGDHAHIGNEAGAAAGIVPGKNKYNRKV